MRNKHFSPETLSERRMEAVRLRLDGHTVADTTKRTGLSAPTVSAAWKAFKVGGWGAVPVRPRGRTKGQSSTLGAAASEALLEQLATLPPPPEPGWTSSRLVEALKNRALPAPSPRNIDHWLETHGLKPAPMDLAPLARRRSQAGRWYRQQVQPQQERLRKAGGLLWTGGVRVLPPTPGAPRRYRLYVHGKRGTLFLRCLPAPPEAQHYLDLFQRLVEYTQGPVGLVFHGAYFQASQAIQSWLREHPEFHLINVPPDSALGSAPRANRRT